MAVKSVSDRKSPNKVIGYPKLMIAGKPEIVVLFRESKKGVVVWAESGAGYEVGQVSSSWDTPSFTPFTGSITLSNE